MKAIRTSLFILACIIASCQNNPGKVAESSADDSLKTDTIIEQEEEKATQDTTWGDWNVKIYDKENDLKVVDEYIKHDVSHFVSATYKGKEILNRFEINRKWLFKGINETDNDSVYSAGDVYFLTNTTAYLGFFVGYPETDVGYSIIVAVSKDGTVKEYLGALSLSERGYDEMIDFYCLYWNELQQNPVDKASLRKVAKKYCTPSFCKKLEREVASILFPASWPIIKKRVNIFDFYYDDEGPEGIKNWENTLYFMHENKALDSLKVEMVDAKNYPLINGVSSW